MIASVYMSSLFGTDGIRGIVNQFPIDPLSFVKIAQSIGLYLQSVYPNRPIKCVIGKDTRESGYMIECALVSGLVSFGVDVYLVGPLPTPAVAFLTRSMRAAVGIMISASHNPFNDNGIKVFDANGEKLAPHIIEVIEKNFHNMPAIALPDHVGKAKRIDDAVGRYIEYTKSYFAADFSLSGYRIVLDCANGAAYKIAPIILRELGADVITLANHPDGRNINADCGSLHPKNLAQSVKDHKADLGIGLDGDADRLVLIDEHGQIVQGECLLGFLGLHVGSSKKLVTTNVANPALEEFLKSHGIETFYTDVGDRHVYMMMRDKQAYIGGEPSGHILFGTEVCASDGLLTALTCLEILKRHNQPVSIITHLFTLMPTKQKNVRIDMEKFKKIDVSTLNFSNIQSRYIVRKSGTENVIRIQIWNQNPKDLEKDFETIETHMGNLVRFT